jgi:hypothetical protein
VSHEQRLRRILSHHRSHNVESGDAVPFLNIYVGEDVMIQLSHGVLHPPYEGGSEERKRATRILESEEGVEYEEHLGWWLPGKTEWTVDSTFELVKRLLEVGGHATSDITHVDEQDCPEGGLPNWADLSAEKSTSPGKPYNLDIEEAMREDLDRASSQSLSIELHRETWEILSNSDNQFGPNNPSNMPIVEYRFEFDGQTGCQYAYHSLSHFVRSVPERRKQVFSRIFHDTADFLYDLYEPFEQWDVFLELTSLTVEQHIAFTHRLIRQGFGVEWDDVEVVDVRDELMHPRDRQF